MTFSNSPKIQEDGSYQSYPSTDANPASNPPQTGAVSTGTLAYNNFFRDRTYHFSFTSSHTGPQLRMDFRSSLFEGKGTDDESWGLDNVVVSIDAAPGKGRQHR
jgi:hypothetical protein